MSNGNAKYFLIAAAVFLAGCASVNIPYPSADDVPDAAEIVHGGDVFIYSVDDKGCYTGHTELGGHFRVRPGVKVVLGTDLRNRTAGWVCKSFLAFTPEANARYAMRPRLVSIPVKGIFKGRTVPGCLLSMVQLGEGGLETLVSVEPRRARSGFSCTRFVDPREKARRAPEAEAVEGPR